MSNGASVPVPNSKKETETLTEPMSMQEHFNSVPVPSPTETRLKVWTDAIQDAHAECMGAANECKPRHRDSYLETAATLSEIAASLPSLLKAQTLVEKLREESYVDQETIELRDLELVELRSALSQAQTERDAALKDIESLTARIAELTVCYCGKPLREPLCPSCDFDYS